MTSAVHAPLNTYSFETQPRHKGRLSATQSTQIAESDEWSTDHQNHIEQTAKPPRQKQKGEYAKKDGQMISFDLAARFRTNVSNGDYAETE